jgi:hypothetical protein
MSAKLFRLMAISAILAGALAATAAAQDFQKSYQLAAGGSIRIGNISGDVTVTGYDGNAVTVTGTKEGANPDVITIEDRSTGSTVNIGVHYPNNCHNCDASVQFKVQVPRSISYNFDRLRSISGDVSVSGVTGRVDASTVSGEVRVTDVAGSVSGKSVSGDVEVELTRLDGADDMHFSTVSGDVSVKVPAALDANVEMSSFSGSLDTTFPIQIQKDTFTTRQTATGQVGSGGRRLHISTISGSVSLKQL